MTKSASSASTSLMDLGLSSPFPANILKDVVAFVEVRTGNDNRSGAVKRVLERMGAKVEDTLSENVTHVIFKEGKKRTKDRAQKLGAHLVSVLWVESCKEKQQRVAEQDFLANTDHCSTPPPGVRWKKYRSMQPRSFEDEVALSAERCQKRRRKIDNSRHLLEGRDSKMPFHSNGHILVMDTQSQTPFAAMTFQSPVVIPSTPPSMLTRLDEMRRQKEARRLGASEESPSFGNILTDLPVPKTLFSKLSGSQVKDFNKGVDHAGHSSQICSAVTRQTLPNTISSKEIAPQCNTQTQPVPESALQLQSSGGSQSKQSGLRGNQRRQSDFVRSSTLPSKSFSETSAHLNRVNKRYSLNNILPRPVNEKQSQVGKQCSEITRCNQHAQKHPRMQTRESVSNSYHKNIDMREEHENAKKAGHNVFGDGFQSENNFNDGHRPNFAVRRSVRRCSTVFQKSKEEDTVSGCVVLNLSQKPPSVSDTLSSKPTSKRRKLLNPSHKLCALSPLIRDNQNLSSVLASEKNQEQSRKRKCDDVDTVFPASRKDDKSVKQKQRKSSQKSGEESSCTESNVSKEDERPAKSRKLSHDTSKGQSGSVSTLCSVSQESGIASCSMSAVFNCTPVPVSCSNRLAPPRNSLAEFQIQKPRHRSKLAAAYRNEGRRRNKNKKAVCLLSQHKSQLNCLPSLVMTSLHREEQEVVILAVKRLGDFRIEDQVSENTTHVVYGEPRRTLNVLHGLGRGCWLINKNWVIQSEVEGHWLSEADFEAGEDIPKAREARLAREAEPPGRYKCRIFESAGSFFLSNKCTPPRTQLSKLLQLCRAKVTDSLKRCDFYIGDESHEEKISIKPAWVLDCISQQKLLPVDDYVITTNFQVKISSSPEY